MLKHKKSDIIISVLNKKKIQRVASTINFSVNPVVDGFFYLKELNMRANFSTSNTGEFIPVSTVKKEIEMNFGKRITVFELNKNSKKTTNEFNGEIVAAYNNFFSMKILLNQTIIEKCFNYSGFSVGLLKYKIHNN